MRLSLTRREVLCGAVAVGWQTGTTRASGDPAMPSSSPQSIHGMIQTVLGPIPASQFGLALPHEHVMCDFAGAEQTGRHRWNVAEVVRVMKPFLQALRRRGVRGFVDCTPAFIGRDPRVLQQLARETGLHILTSTGYYGGASDRFLPPHAFSETPQQLAARWIREWEQGIEDTGVRPGHIKIGVDEATGDPPSLSAVDAKLVDAAAIVSRRTGLTVTCHTGGAIAGYQAAERFVRAGGSPARFIVAHSDGHGTETNRRVAELGCWVSLDGHGSRALEAHLATLEPLLERHAHRLLLSMDSGWYNVGEPEGGRIRDYTYLTDTFLPALRRRGIAEAVIRRLTVENPARAFALVPAPAITAEGP
ncbi:MAG: hypothetical protein RMJ43_04030 [Chloroherpetonaceae bacterium]|nr:hypothetical protein [Chthonomonadaceae bacterium]MDW8206980.1 hypothetical protein [Chloroherpetonaceae bacterium]